MSFIQPRFWCFGQTVVSSAFDRCYFMHDRASPAPAPTRESTDLTTFKPLVNTHLFRVAFNV